MHDTGKFVALAETWYHHCRVQQGERVVILADSGIEPAIVQGFFAVAVARGADAVTAVFPRPSRPFSDIPLAIERALAGADFIHELLGFSWAHSPSRARIIGKIQATGQGRMAWGGHERPHLEVPPDGRVIERVRQAATLIERAKEIRITSTDGTDLRWKRGGAAPSPVLGHGGDVDRPGRIGGLGGGIAYSGEAGTANGVVYVNGGVEMIDPDGTPAWIPQRPVRVEVAAGRITTVDTGVRDGVRFARWLEAFDDESMFDFVQTNLGLDGRARFREADGRLWHSRCASGGILLGFGRNVSPLLGIDHPAPGRVDLFLRDHDYFVDGRQIMANGRFTEPSGLA